MVDAVSPKMVAAGDDVDEEGLRRQLRKKEIEIVCSAVRRAEGDRRLAARRLGISLSSLYRKLGETVPS
jgi:transcriptional regulator with PAS, ATPase and Fis domain